MKLIIARHLIPCTGGRAQVTETETGILIENGLIRRVDRLEAFEEERRGGKVEIIDAGDSYVLPGLIDAHLHLSFSSSAQPLDQLYRDDEATVLLRMVKFSDVIMRMPVMVIMANTETVAPPMTLWGMVVSREENLGTKPATARITAAKANTARLTTRLTVTIPTFWL